VTEFLTSYGVVIALACAGAAVVYGLLTTRWLLALSPGNAQMQEISLAVQEGAQAYLKRQYTIIAGVAVVLAVVIAVLINIETAIGFVIGGTLSAAAGFIGMNVSVRANARVAERAREGVAGALDVAFKGARSPACSSPASRCSASPATTACSWCSARTSSMRSTRSWGSASAAH
jgi:Inorganic pyrophosphatase